MYKEQNGWLYKMKRFMCIRLLRTQIMTS